METAPRRSMFANETDVIYVIESLKEGGMRTGSAVHANAISPHARPRKIDVMPVQACESAADVLDAIDSVRQEVERRGRHPILQVDCHGDPDGLELADGSRLGWPDLAVSLRQLNLASRNSLVVVASACDGAFMAKILTTPYDGAADDPFRGRCACWGIIGPVGKVAADDLRRGLEAFYSFLPGSVSVPAAIARMNACFRAYADYAESVHQRSFAEFVRVYAVPESLDERVRQECKRTGEDPAQVRAWFLDFPARFAAFRRRYLWLDMFPDQESRFTLTYDDVLKQL